VTTAPIELDSPATITLHAATFSDVALLCTGPLPRNDIGGQTSARLVLVDAMELAWQRARCRGNQHLLLPAHPVLAGLTTLQHWLWQRLQAPTTNSVAA
jgi:hypothetical protein